jgi:hypothetical protein
MATIAKIVIVIEIDGQTIELSRQQAEELRSILDSVIGVKVTAPPAREKEYIPYPYPVPTAPYVYPRWYNDWSITCVGTTATLTAASG